MIRTPRVRAPDLDRDQGRRADPQISPRSSASIANCCTKLALTSLNSRWWHPLSLDTIPQVGPRTTEGRGELDIGQVVRLGDDSDAEGPSRGEQEHGTQGTIVDRAKVRS